MNDEVTLCKCMYRVCLCARRHRHLKEPLVFLMAWRASVFRLSILSFFPPLFFSFFLLPICLSLLCVNESPGSKL